MKKTIFVQLPPPRFRFEDIPTNIPLAAGFIADAMKTSGMDVDSHILESEVTDVFADSGVIREIRSREPDILAMSLYLWNSERSLFIAAKLKECIPHLMVVVGGPEVTADNDWIMNHPAVDIGIFGEGESRISVFESISKGSLPLEIPASFVKDKHRRIINTDAAPEYKLTNDYPYLSGAISPSRTGTLFLETVRGCPFRCRYCYYHKSFQRVRPYPFGCIERLLDFAYSADSIVKEIYLMDPTFNVRKRFGQILKSFEERRRYKDIELHTELRADLLSRDHVDLLKAAGLKSAEIGLQSINPVALKTAGRRSGDPERTAKGASMLKEAGMEVTTGIILGLPDDTPEGYSKTLKWLKQREPFSVVHPFMLSVLPGTDFRADSQKLHLEYQRKPPYFVQSTVAFRKEDLARALLETEEVLDMEMDYIPPPSLTDQGPSLSDPEQAYYISKWIVDTDADPWERYLPHVISKATDPFTVWFKGDIEMKRTSDLLNRFVVENPHTVLRPVFEPTNTMPAEWLQIFLESSANPDTFINRYYEPLYGENEIVSVDFTVILPFSKRSSDLAESYESFATVVWDITDPEQLHEPDLSLPILISFPCRSMRLLPQIFGILKDAAKDRPEEILFRDPLPAFRWNTMMGCRKQPSFAERILCRQ